jgi:NOL1/NOP2/fmu family ribosome biogenesis protein
MKVEILDNPKKKKMIAILEKESGISNLNYLFIKTGKDKYRIYSGGFSRDELNWLGKNIHIELIGLKFCTFDREQPRLNFDVMNLPDIKENISKNIIELNDAQFEEWAKGENILSGEDLEQKYYFIKHGKDIYGSGKRFGDSLKNFVPAEKRLKKKQSLMQTKNNH